MEVETHPRPPLKGSASYSGSSGLGSFEIGYLFSSPLVYARSPGGAPEVVKQLNVEEEKKSMVSIFDEAFRQLRVRFEMARTESLNVLIRHRCKALHFSGHGVSNCLAFETDDGEFYPVPASILKDIVSGSDSLKFVFVAACHSEAAGRAFVEAGVPHVVAVRWDTPISDTAAMVFSKHFYLALLLGHTVERSFYSAKAMVQADPNIMKEGEHDKFLLLPEETDHMEVIFESLEEGSWVDVTPVMIHNSLISPPDKFRGREVAIHDILKVLFKVRFVSIHGPRDIGKSAVARYISKHILVRRIKFWGIFFVDIKKSYKNLSKEDPMCIGYLLWLELVASDLLTAEDPCRSNREFLDAFARLTKRPLLFVIDGADSFFKVPESSQWSLTSFLKDFFGRFDNVKVLTTSRERPPYIQDASRFDIALSPLSDRDIADLIKEQCPRKLTSEEIGKKRDSSFADHALIKAIKGVPGLACKVASAMASLNINEVLAHIDEFSENEKEADELDHLDLNLKIDPEKERRFQKMGVSRPGMEFWVSLTKSDSVPMTIFLDGLKKLFRKKMPATCRRHLDQSELDFFMAFLRDKCGNSDSVQVSVVAFCTFWTWFEACVEVLIRIEDVWDNDKAKIVHLNTRVEALRVLESCRPGTVLIRFSESNPGQLAAAYVLSTGKVSMFLIETKFGDFRFITAEKIWQNHFHLKDLILEWPSFTIYTNGLPKTEAFPGKSCRKNGDYDDFEVIKPYKAEIQPLDYSDGPD